MTDVHTTGTPDLNSSDSSFPDFVQGDTTLLCGFCWKTLASDKVV
jgi:hypothetical protein